MHRPFHDAGPKCLNASDADAFKCWTSAIRALLLITARIAKVLSIGLKPAARHVRSV